VKFSAKQPTPDRLSEWIALANENWTPAYQNMPGDVKDSLHLALLREQGYVCSYCGQKLHGRGDSHIDHFWPQTDFPERALDYTNLFASCGPPGRPGSPKNLPSTCGDAKKAWFHCTDYIMPSDSDCEYHFKYGGSGSISPAMAGDVAAENMISHLRLGDPSLVNERSVLIALLEADITANEITLSNKQAEVLSWRTPDATGRLSGFGHVAARYLEDEL
jgi:uncharacterized protein (TIGR02646 family)